MKVFTEINRRGKLMLIITACLLFLLFFAVSQLFIDKSMLEPNLVIRNIGPEWKHIFGTDWMGRDMLSRTLVSLGQSFRIGLFAGFISVVIATLFGITAGMAGGKTDSFICILVDIFMSLPHLVLLILISFILGGGVNGVIYAVALTHWPRLTRLIRAEVVQIKNSDYVNLSFKLGRNYWWIARKHLLPAIMPQIITGGILLFPHAILHEAGLTFIGIGLPPHSPAIGTILSESMRYLSAGYWWLAVMPGLALLFMVKIFDVLGENLNLLFNPRTRQE